MTPFVFRYGVSPSRKEMKRAIQRALTRQQAQLAAKIQFAVCPEHKLRAQVSVVKGALQVTVCCSKLEAAIREELKPE